MFSGSAAVAVEFVVPRTAETDAYLEQLLADRHVRCVPFQSMNHQDQLQSVGEIEFIDLPGLPEESLAWTATFSVSGAGGYAGLACFMTAGHFVMIQLQAVEPITASTVQVLAVTAYQNASAPA